MTVALILYAVVALGLLAMAAKFGLGPVPAPHHGAALTQDGVAMTPKLEMVLRGVYQAMAGAYLALAIIVAWLAFGPLREGQSWAAWLIAVAGLCTGAPAAFRARQVQQATGTTTPWLAAAALTALAVVASIIALAAIG